MNEPKYGTPEWKEYEDAERAKLAEDYEEVWNTDEVTAEFDVQSFLAPFCFVVRRSTGEEGSLMFQASPRFYFDFKPSGVMSRKTWI